MIADPDHSGDDMSPTGASDFHPVIDDMEHATDTPDASLPT